MAKWFGKEVGSEEDAGKQVEAKFTEVEKTQATIIASQETQSKSIDTLSSVIKEMNDREKAKEAKILKDQNERRQQEVNDRNKEKTPEMIAEELLNDPAAFIANQVSGATRLTLLTHSKQVREEVLSGKEYYHGDFKKEVNDLIDSEPNLATRGMANFIMNCYKVALGNHISEIQEGKMQKSTAMHGFSDGGNGGGSKGDEKPSVEYRDPKSRFAAAQLGLTDEDVVKAAKDQAIHGLEVVA